MRKTFLAITALIISVNLTAQDIEIFEHKAVVDQQYTSGQNVHVRANKSIILDNGFKFTSSGTNTFLAEIEEKELAMAEEESLTGGPAGDIGELVGTDGVVGAIPGNFNVSPSGAATYTIPIECPAGINGMTPQVALSYNSQGGNGIAGWGWNVAASSSISRVPKNYYLDAKAKAIQWDDTDVFAYNGVRMVEINSGSGWKEYRLVNDSKVKIVAYDWTSDGPGWFKVSPGDGKTYFYGNTWDSKMSLEWDSGSSRAPGDILAWNLARMEDTYQNYIEYLYVYDSTIVSSIVQYRDYRIENIDYTGNSVTESAPFYKINFNYESRTEALVSYVSLKKSINQRRLKEIWVEYSGTARKSYRLYYEESNGITHLESVKLFKPDGEEYNKTVFSRPEMTLDDSNEVFSEYTGDRSKVLDQIIPGDFNGDGVTDLCIRYYINYNDSLSFYYSYYTRKFEDGEIVTSYVGTLQYGRFREAGWLVKKTMEQSLVGSLIDYNGDGELDLVCLSQDHSWYNYKIFDLDEDNQSNHFIELTHGAFEFAGDLDSDPDSDDDFEGESLPYFTIGEVNGDGKADLIFINRNAYIIDDETTGKHWVKLLVSNSTGYTNIIDTISINDTPIEQFLVIDYDADGLSDIIGINSSGAKIFKSNYLAPFYSQGSSLGNLFSGDEIMTMGYFNNDNLIDVILRRNGYIFACYNKGDGFTRINTGYACSTSCTDDTGDRVIACDFNNDGFTDFIKANEIFIHPFLSDWEYDRTTWQYYKNTGTSFVELTDLARNNSIRTKAFTIDDFFADGISDEFTHNNSLNRFELVNNYNSNVISEKNISKITNGLGVETEISYGRLINCDSDISIYTYDSNTEPYRTLKSPNLVLVKSVDNGVSKNSYTYHNALLTFEKGFLGIEKVTVENDISNTKTVNETTFENTFFTPSLISSKTYFDDTELISESEQTFETTQVSGIRYKQILREQTNLDYLKDIKQTTTIHSVDNYGNPERVDKKVFELGEMVPQAIQRDSFEYISISSPYYTSLVEKHIESRYGADTIIRVQDFEYNSNGSLCTEFLHKNDPFEIIKQYVYDQYGHIILDSISALRDNSIPTQNRVKYSKYTYSQNGRFLTVKENSVGDSTSYSYDEILGVLVSKTDNENNLTVNYEYDDFGRKIKSTSPDDLESMTTIHWVDGQNDAPTGALIYSISQQSGVADTYTYSDKYGRELRTVTINFNGDKLYTDKIYNSKGQLWKSSLSYEPTDNALYDVYSYDDYGRNNSILFADGRTKSTTFNSGYIKEQISKDGEYQFVKKYFNAVGEVYKTVDVQNFTVLTSYSASGLPVEYDYGSGNKVTLEYDINGNRTSIDDPNAGIVLSTYNAFGELIEQVDAKGNKSEIEYDILSRVVQKSQYLPNESIANNIITYTYDNDSDFTGTLTAISQTNRKSRILYDYDSFGRTVKESEIYYTNPSETDSIRVDFETEYDDLGRMISRILPDNMTINYSYTENGDLSTIYNDSVLFWECKNTSSLGQITSYKMGSRSSNNYYDDYGVLDTKILSGYKRFDYTYDDFGNMTSRKDATYNLEEKFSYDNMNRLTDIEYYDGGIHQSASDVTMGYTSNGYGNMSSKSDVGEFTYGETIDVTGASPAGPHALTSIDNLVNYLPRDQEITYTQFNKVSSITEYIDESDEISLEITYGIDGQRRQSEYTDSRDSNAAYSKFYFGDYEEVLKNGEKTGYYYISAPTGLCGILQRHTNSSSQVSDTIWHVNTDHLGSPTILFDAMNYTNQKEYSFSAWGVPRDPTDWSQQATDTLFADRGFTGHEHLSEFGLINMNGRVYDPMLGRFLSPDPYVQMPGMRGGFNRYGYCLNNPLLYTDPSGEIFWLIPAAIAIWAVTTESGYEVQKYISPVAIHIDIKAGTHQTGLGFDVSVGVPKALPVSYRFNYGKTYYWETYGDHSGWETRKGGEWTLFGLVNYSGTTFSGAGYPRDQTVNTITLGGPFVNVKYENDTYLGNFKLPGVPQGDPYSDGYRTAAARIKFGPLSVGMILHTGDSPSPTGMQQYQDTDGDGIADAWVMTGGDIQDESQSHGIFYVGFGPLKIGRDSEKIRNYFQNEVAHDGFNGGSRGSAYPWVKPFWDRDPRWYFQFGWGNGSTLY